MNYQKDIKNTDLNSYGHSNVPSDKILVNKEIYEYSYKKTEKIVTALYMVTDCMEVDDALKGKIRTLGVELLSYIHKLSHVSSSPVDNHTSVSNSLLNIDEIISLINIANTIGFISDMNTSILRKELTGLLGELKTRQTKDNNFTFTLNQKMFNVELEPSRILTQGIIKDKRTERNNLSFMNRKASGSLSFTKGLNAPNQDGLNKKDRMDKILSIIKNLPLQGNKKDLSIKDISTMFTDCSEKTIQRELNLLVLKGQIKKTGAKRWSRYAPITI